MSCFPKLPNRRISFLYLANLTIYFNLAAAGACHAVDIGQLENWDGQYQCAIYAFYQDETGIIWIGTNRGLKRYNGNGVEEIDIFSSDDYPSRQVVTHICGDADGHLFLKVDNYIVAFSIPDRNTKILWRGPGKVVLGTGNHSGSVFIGVRNEVSCLSGEEFVVHRRLADTTVVVTTILESSRGELYVGTETGNVYLIDGAGGERKIIKGSSRITTMSESSRGEIWIGTLNNGIYRYDPESDDLVNYNSALKTCGLMSNYIRTFCEDRDGHIWAGTMNGLHRIDSVTGRIDHYSTGHGLKHASVWALMKDHQGGIWVGGFYGGVNYFTTGTGVFELISFEREGDSGFPAIGRVVVDKRGALWMCTEGKGLLYYDPGCGKQDYFSIYPHNTPKTLYYDQSGDILWIGTHVGGLYRLDVLAKTLSHFQVGSNMDDPDTEVIHEILPYGDYLFLGTLTDVYRFDTSTGDCNREVLLPRKMHTGSTMLIDDDHNLWIGGNGLYTYGIESGRLTDHSSSGSLRTRDISALYRDGKGHIWVGTRNNGLARWDRERDELHFFDGEINLPSSFVNSIAESSRGYILVSTDKGFSYIDPESMQCRNFSTWNGFPLLSMRTGSVLSLQDDKILFSGLNGVVLTDEKSLLSPSRTTGIFPDRLWVNNREVVPDDGTKILKNSLRYTDEISLNYKQTVLSIELASDNYVPDYRTLYQYRLEGFDRQWLDLDDRNTVNYMNLRPGTYRLAVRNPDEPDTVKTVLTVEVLPAFYASWWAYLVYLVVTLSATVWIVSFYRSKLVLKATLQQREIANQSKFRFFTNLTHEFRTPVTLMLGRLEQLIESEKLPLPVRKSLSLVHGDAVHMKNLTDEFLDFRTIEEGYKRLRISSKDIVEEVRATYESFVDHAAYKDISLVLDVPGKELPLFIDSGQIRKVLNNLLSNAFKFTPAQGTIRISVKETNDGALISISDTGIGMDAKKLQNIFDSFYQIDDPQSPGIDNPGTGIGLAFAKEIVSLHHGNIRVESTPGAGSTFHVSLFAGESHFQGDTHIRKETISGDNDPTNDTAILPIETESIPARTGMTLLIVEDNRSMRELLLDFFRPLYNVIAAADGNEGLDLARTKFPDIIVTDVRMPGMPGTELCRLLKQDIRTSHIPVILLTAQPEIEHNIEGLRCGADDYITKPFDKRILMVRCENLLNNRRLLQEKYTRQVNPSPGIITGNARDRRFIGKVTDIIQNHLDDPEFNVAILSRETAMSRTVLTAKIKGITGMNPADFIQNIRLKKAAWLLRNEQDKTISEISDETGFSSAKYFTRCFRELFGITPSKFRQRDE